MALHIQTANLDAEDFRELIAAHKSLMLESSPPESSHALLIDGLKAPGISVWEMRDGGKLVGCGALKALKDGKSGEIKSMHTVAQFRGAGLGQIMVRHILAEAKSRYYGRLLLETGSQQAFAPARRLYQRNGFSYCGPFEDYLDDPHSVFMERVLD